MTRAVAAALHRLAGMFQGPPQLCSGCLPDDVREEVSAMTLAHQIQKLSARKRR